MCVNALCPDLPLEDRKDRARQVLDICRSDYRPDPRITISPAQVSEIVWRNFQCANRFCSAVLFGELIAEELNEFFRREE